MDSQAPKMELSVHDHIWLAEFEDYPALTAFFAAEVGISTGKDLSDMINSPDFKTFTGNATTLTLDGSDIHIEFDLPTDPGWETKCTILRKDLLELLEEWAEKTKKEPDFKLNRMIS